MVSFSQISGDPVLDLLNTVQWRLGGPDREEELVSYALVLTWSHEAGLISSAERARLARAARSDLAGAERERVGVVNAREHAYCAMFEHDADAVSSLAETYRESLESAELVHDANGWRWTDRALDLSSPRHRIVRGLVALMGRDDLDRLHQCEDARCGWVYLDTSPRQNRRWCVTKDCGDRNRARAYYTRQKARRQAG